MSTKKSIGERVREYRQSLSLTQEKLAEEVAVSTTTISRLEHGDQMVSALKLLEIAEVLHIGIEHLTDDREGQPQDSDEWNGKILILLEQYPPEQKKHLWEILVLLLEMIPKQ